MKYLEKYDLFIDDDLVVYRHYHNTVINGKKVPNCYLVQLQWNLQPNGYMYTRFRGNGKNHSIYLHRLLAEVFIPNPENKTTVDHINHIRTDNRLENLQWATRVEQVAFRKLSAKERKERKRRYDHEYYLKKKKAA